jgi:hypothetical protein
VSPFGDQETAVEMALRERNTAEQELESMQIATHQQVFMRSVYHDVLRLCAARFHF